MNSIDTISKWIKLYVISVWYKQETLADKASRRHASFKHINLITFRKQFYNYRSPFMA